MREEVTKIDSIREFVEYAISHPEVSDALSPGAAAVAMGVSRTRVHQLVEAHKLRSWIVRSQQGERAAIVLVSEESIRRYLASPRRPGPVPKSLAA